VRIAPTKLRGRLPFHAIAGLVLLLAAPAVAEPGPACGDIVAQLGDDAGPYFLASYPTAAVGPLHGAAFTYDNALAAIALLGCGDQRAARRIGDALLAALDRDRYWHDGRLRNAYAAGPVAAGPVKLAGWWDAKTNRWLEDRYQAGSDTGNMAWAMLALLALDQAGAGSAYRAGAVRIGEWAAGRRDRRGPGGFTGGTFGHEPKPEDIAWKSTEHNADLAAAFRRLANATGDQRWRDLSDAAGRFVAAMWDGGCGCFAAGTGDDGATRNPTLALDAQILPLLALPGMVLSQSSAFATAEDRLRHGPGFAYALPATAIWTEGTAQASLFADLAGRKPEAQALLATAEADHAPGGGYFATDAADLPTGFGDPTDLTKPRLYFHLPHLAATAWVALAERGLNPFTGRPALP